jgi:hypothetical protein
MSLWLAHGPKRLDKGWDLEDKVSFLGKDNYFCKLAKMDRQLHMPVIFR